MKRPFNRKEERKEESSLNRFHGEAATASVENAGIAYQSPSVIAAGADAQVVGVLSFLFNLVLSLFCIQSPRITQRMGPTKKTVVILSLINTITWLPLVLAFLLGKSISPIWLVVLWIINLIPATMLSPLRDSWLVDTVPSHSMGRYFGVRSMVSGIAYLGTFFMMGYVMDSLSQATFKGFSAIFAIAFIASLTSFALFTMIKAPPHAKEKSESKAGFIDFAKEIKKGNLGTFILYISLFSLSVSLCGPLFSVYMLKDLHFSYLTFTAVVSAEYIARIASASFWGKYSDRVGTLKILGIVSRIIPFIPILWLFSSNVGYLIAVQLISGTVWAGFDLCSQTFLYKAAPQSKRLKYIVYQKGLTTLATALGALAGAYLLTHTIPVFGSQILGLFLLSGISRWLVVQFMFHKLVDLTFTPDPSRIKSPVDLASAIQMADLKHGLFYYRPQDWVESLGGALSSGAMIAAKVESSQQGLLYQPKKWKQFIDKPSESEAAMNEATAPPNDGLFYQPHKWGQFVDEPPAPDTRDEANPEIEPSREGLFYRTSNREKFARKRDATATVPEATGKEAPDKQIVFHSLRKPSQPVASKLEPEVEITPSKDGLLYRPQSWQHFTGEPQPEVAEIAPSQEGFYYRTANWKDFIHKLDSAAYGSEASKVGHGLSRPPQKKLPHPQFKKPVPATRTGGISALRKVGRPLPAPGIA